MPLTDREWFLVRAVRLHTLLAVLVGCQTSGLPGRVVAQGYIDVGPPEELRAQVAEFMKEYKPDA